MIKLSLVSFILIVQCAFLIRAQAAQVSIIIRESSKVNGSKLLLGDIAEFNGISDSQKKQLSSVELGDAPAFGESRQFSNVSIAEALRAGMGDMGLGEVKLQIPTTITITGKGISVSESEIKTRIAAGIVETCPACEVRVIDLVMPALGEISPQARWEIRGDLSRVRGSFQIALEIFEPQQNKKIFWLTGRIQIMRSVPIVTRNLAPGLRVQPGDFIMGRRDVTFLFDTSPTEAEAVGSLLKVPVQANQVLLRSHIKKQPALNRGQDVTITSGQNVWSVSMKGISQDEGYVGDIVKVQNPETKKIVVGVIVAEGVVEVR